MNTIITIRSALSIVYKLINKSMLLLFLQQYLPIGLFGQVLMMSIVLSIVDYRITTLFDW